MSGINIGIGVTGADTAATQLGKVSTSLGGVAKASNTAGQSLVNLGRIAQDAPFGFIGIQNNINPLIESFGRLKAETGSTGNAFKALLAGLLGPAGIGVAVSVVTGALTILSQKGFFKTSEAADDSAKKIADFNKELKSAEASALATGVKLQAFANIAADQNVPLEQRNNALREANKLLGDHGEKLTLVTVGTAAATQRINEYTNALTARAVAEKFANRIADLRIQQIEANRQYEESLQKVADAEKRTKDLALSNVSAAAVAGQGNLVQRAADQSKSAAQNLASINKQIETLNADFRKVVLESTKVQLLKDTDTQTKDVGEKVKKKIDKIKKVVKESKIGFLELPANIRLITREDAAADIAEANRIAKEQQDRLDKLFKNATPINIPLNVRVSDKEKELRQYYTQLANVAQEQQDIFLKAVVDSFVAIGEGLGNIITGKAGFGELFAGIGQIFGNALKELGKSVIAASTLIASLKKALNAAFAGNPILGVVAGVALIALGTVIQNSLPKFANGVTNFGGGMALVGERGPEIVRLPSGSDVIPNFRLNSMKASSPMAYIPNVTLRGSDLIIAMQRQAATNRRSGGGGYGWTFAGDSLPNK